MRGFGLHWSSVPFLYWPFRSHGIFRDSCRELSPRMDLGVENYLGAWWSGVLLFMLAYHAYDAGSEARERAPKVATAWRIIAAIFLFLSVDEIGSIHERLAIIGQALAGSDWILVLPLGGVIGICLLYALFTLWTSGDATRQYVLPLFCRVRNTRLRRCPGVFRARPELGGGTARLDSPRDRRRLRTAGHDCPALGCSETLDEVGPAAFYCTGDNPRALFITLIVLIPIFTAMIVVASDHRGSPTDWLTIVSFVAAGLLAFSSPDGQLGNRLLSIHRLGSFVPHCINCSHVLQ